MFSKYSYEEVEFRVFKSYGHGHPPVLTRNLPQLYNCLLPISKVNMDPWVAKGVPEEFCACYKSLPVDKKKNDFDENRCLDKNVIL